MIQPVKAISYQTNPVVQSAQKAYRDNANPARLGEKLNINLNDQRYVVRQGKRLDYIA